MARRLRLDARAVETFLLVVVVVVLVAVEQHLVAAAVILVATLRAGFVLGFRLDDQDRVALALVFLVLVANGCLLAAAVVLINVLASEKRLRVLGALVRGSSVRDTEEIAGVHRDTIVRFVRTFGAGCIRLHNALVRDLSCSFIEVDEQHSFVQVKQAHLRPEHSTEAGDTWTWVAIHRRSRLVLAFYVGKRTEQAANAFIGDLRARLVTMPQITSDGLALYAPAIARAFGPGVDFAMTVKAWNTSKRRRGDAEAAEGELLKIAVLGDPDLSMATTAHDERLNLTIRHTNGRMRRKSLAFSKSLASHEGAAALAYVHYNFCHVVRTLKTTPAVCAGIADHRWTLPEFMDAVLSAPPCEPPEAKPLRPRDRSAVVVPRPAASARPTKTREVPLGQLGLFEWRPPVAVAPSPVAPPPSTPPVEPLADQVPRPPPLMPPLTQLDLFGLDEGQ